MKFKFNFELSAESGKFAANDFSAELGKIDCPVTVEVELEAAEVQQTLGLCKEIFKEIPNMIEKYQNGERETASHRAKLDEHLEDVRRRLEADNIRLRADRAENAAALQHMRNIELAQLNAKLHNDQPSEQPSEQPDEPQPDERHNRNHRK